jgi:hypothetical protein
MNYSECEFGVIKCKKKFFIKKGASSQNFEQAESSDFQYKSKKYFDNKQFMKEIQDELNYQLFDDNLLEFDDLNINFNYVFQDILRFFIPSNVRNVGKHTVIHTFSQNSHDQNINNSLMESISKINDFFDWNTSLSKSIEIFGKIFVDKYLNWNEHNIKLIYGKILYRILTYDHNTKIEAINILKSEIIDGYGYCLTGRINRIISSLCGIDKDIQQKISLSQQFTLIFDALRQKYSYIDIFSNQFIELFKKECYERNIDNLEVELYINSIIN